MDAHALVRRLENDIRTADPSIADVAVHAEPAGSEAAEDTSREP
jgi:divalent metal cation (Fe/Co/Zn/Cd) transporter